MTTALESGESADGLTERCHALADFGVQHVVMIARGRPFTDQDLDTVAGAAVQVAGSARKAEVPAE